jgi:hypothetical protein
MSLAGPLRLCLPLFVAFSVPIAAYAQGCSLCYTQAAAAGTRMIEALRSGILVLIIPPLFLSIGITVLAYRKRNQFRDAGYVSQEDEL